jgi:hypothetical protein
VMHEPEKSDSAVVAMKPTNNAERSAAELVEPRAGTKGNADQQSTRRAQDRESVSQALERVRLVEELQEASACMLPGTKRAAPQRRLPWTR